MVIGTNGNDFVPPQVCTKLHSNVGEKGLIFHSSLSDRTALSTSNMPSKLLERAGEVMVLILF